MLSPFRLRRGVVVMTPTCDHTMQEDRAVLFRTAFLSVPEGGGVLGCPFSEAEGGAAQNLLHGVRRRSRMMDEAGPVAEQSIGDVLGKALGEHRLANLRRRDLLPMEFAAYGLADQANPVALGEGLRAAEQVGLANVGRVRQCQCADRSHIPIVNGR